MSDKQKVILCPYCGNTQTEPEDRCTSCGGFFDSLSLKVTQQAMGPWFVRDRHMPFRPGCTYEVLRSQIEKGKIKPTTILRGPTTRQFWSVARNVPGVANLLGYCHACGSHVKPGDDACVNCGEVFFIPKLRDQLGLAPLDPDVQAQAARARRDLQVGSPASTEAEGEAAVTQEALQSTGSGILANLRLPEPVDDLDLGEPATLPAAQPAPPLDDSVRQPARQATEPAPGASAHDAMQWMTGTGDDEPDDLETAGEALSSIQRKSGGMNLTTWLLIGMNVLLLVAVALVIVLIIVQTEPKPEPTPAPPPIPDNFTPPEPPTTGSNTHRTPPEPTPTNTTPPTTTTTTASVTPPTPEPPQPTSPVANAWQRMYQQALESQKLGQLDRAKALLNQIDRQAPNSLKPEGVDAALAKVTAQLSEREVKRFLLASVPKPTELPTESSDPGVSLSTPEPRGSGIFSAAAPANDHDRAKQNWKQRFGEALALEIDGDYRRAMSIMEEIAQAPSNQRPAGFDTAYSRIKQKAKGR